LPVVSAAEATPSVDSSAVAPTAAKPRAPASRWVNSVAKDWAVVRAGPSKETRIVASVGPGARVQLGESQGTWRRIRARGIAGWVEPHTAFAAIAPSSARARTIVSR
jgi:SH3-like domain-containing protein